MKESEFVVRPEHFLRYLRTDLKLRPAEMRLPRRAVQVFGGDDFRSLRRRIGGSNLSWNRWIAIGRAGARPAAVFRSHIGAPSSAMDLEEMGVLGVRETIGFGACGSLLEDLRIGDIVMPTFAVPDEGTSRHYGDPRRPRPHPALRDTLVAACERRGLPYREGGVWTTDAHYREHRDRAARLAKRGVVAVDMEASALWSVARHRGRRFASIFVVSDELSGDGWNPGFHHPRYLAGKRLALRAIVDVLARPGR